MSDKLVVFAQNRVEMMEAQTQSVGWAFNKLNEIREELAEAEMNLEVAKTRKWKITGWQNVVRRIKKRVEYYEKIHAALSAGYVIVPNFPIDVFAIRTRRNHPVKHYNMSTSSWGDQVDRTQKSEVLALGEGEHVDSIPIVRANVSTEASGNKQYQWYADEFKDVDFPIKTVKPTILEETDKALLLKIFDEVGCNPGRPGWNPGSGLNRKADPMVIGRIIYKTGSWSEDKSVSFLITWWLDFKDITV